jgi:hypothetical protein
MNLYPGGVEMNAIEIFLHGGPLTLAGYIIFALSLCVVTVRVMKRRFEQGSVYADLHNDFLYLFIAQFTFMLLLFHMLAEVILGATASGIGDGGVHSKAELTNTVCLGFMGSVYVVLLYGFQRKSNKSPRAYHSEVA